LEISQDDSDDHGDQQNQKVKIVHLSDIAILRTDGKSIQLLYAA